MSAFVVDPKTVNRIVSYMAHMSQSKRGPYWTIDREIRATEFSLDGRDNMEALGQAIYNLNIHAVAQRYPGDTLATMPGTHDESGLVAYRFQRLDGITSVGAYKAFQCLLYQMSEGNVPDHILYKALQAIKHAIAEHIVQQLPEYDKAVWE